MALCFRDKNDLTRFWQLQTTDRLTSFVIHNY